MKIKLVADSSANICPNITRELSYVPLRIVTRENDYVDNERLDVPKMLTELRAYKGTSSTACPGIDDWISAFDNSDVVYGVSITGGLSGSYNSAMVAVNDYKETHPDAKVFILDSLSTGPEPELILEKYQELIELGLGFERICEEIKNYHRHTHLLFSLASLDNLAKNGRVSHLKAKAVGVLGLRIIGKASDAGTLEPLSKCRGDKHAVSQLWHEMKSLGYNGGKVRISHTYNLAGAQAMAKKIREHFPDCDISINLNRGLCSYYAEEGAILVAFEDGNK